MNNSSASNNENENTKPSRLTKANMIKMFQETCDTVEGLSASFDKMSAKINELELKVTNNKIQDEVKKIKLRVDELYNAMKSGDDSNCGVKAVDSTHSGLSFASKVAMTTALDRDTVRSAYEDVRADGTPTEWAVFKFDGARIICSAQGSDFTEFRTHFSDDERAFGYLRLQMGDEMSKRRKFIFMTWIGPNVSVINRAKMSTDKSLIKDIISNFAVELQLESQAEIDIDQFKDALNKAGGANYGTGIRDL